MFDILTDSNIDAILNELDSNAIRKNKHSFNIFSISKYGSNLENFHSDILAKLLDPEAEHEEGNLFLNTFLRYLIAKGATINPEDFKDTSSVREKGRIDILITDQVSKKAIIIENKINNATDMDDQLERYFKWCVDKNYTVATIVYITLSGEKMAPQLAAKYHTPVINIEAFINTNTDLVNGWLIPCVGLCATFDSASFIKQYAKLIINLGYNKMNNEALDKFYTIADDTSVIAKINKLKALTDKLPEYRMDKIVSALKDFKPFTKTYRYRPHHMLYERFIENDNSFKLDIYFENNDAHLHFWNPGKAFIEDLPPEDYFKTIEDKIKQIGYEDILLPSNENWVGFYKRFSFEQYNSLQKLDAEFLKFIQTFMNKLNETVV